jgi:hypothetical protein
MGGVYNIPETHGVAWRAVVEEMRAHGLDLGIVADVDWLRAASSTSSVPMLAALSEDLARHDTVFPSSDRSYPHHELEQTTAWHKVQPLVATPNSVIVSRIVKFLVDRVPGNRRSFGVHEQANL